MVYYVTYIEYLSYLDLGMFTWKEMKENLRRNLHKHTHSHMMLFACLAYRLTGCLTDWLPAIRSGWWEYGLFLYISNGTEWIYNIFIDSYMFKSFHHFPHPFHISTRDLTILSFSSPPDEIRRTSLLRLLLLLLLWHKAHAAEQVVHWKVIV